MREMRHTGMNPSQSTFTPESPLNKAKRATARGMLDPWWLMSIELCSTEACFSTQLTRNQPAANLDFCTRLRPWPILLRPQEELLMMAHRGFWTFRPLTFIKDV